MSLPGSILLVGEGNFSFSASLSQQHNETATRVTATCLQSEEEALRHEGAAENIQIINSSGGAVVFGVDCTRLGECACLQDPLFDLVVFNFPHCGRKSGVKKNRDLLKNFFLSCVQVLAEDGEVHVSLCNGQGGTPADQPKREWHNSWQVVAMAAEAHLILTDVRPFESEKYQSYKCTGYSLPYTPAQTLTVEETVDGQKVEFNLPAELSDFMFRGFLSANSVHPVRLVQDFLHKGLTEKWAVHMVTESVPFLLTAERLQACPHGVDAARWYRIRPAERELGADKQDGSSDKADPTRSKDQADAASEGDSGIYVLRPSLLPQIDELFTKNAECVNSAASHGENDKTIEGHSNEGHSDTCKHAPSLFGMSGLVFRNVSVNLWALPSFHQLVLKGIVPSECNPTALLGQRLESLLGPYGVSLVKEEGGLNVTAKPVGVVGNLFASNHGDHTSITACLNLDLLAVVLFSLPDWRLLWSHDPRFLKQFALRPSPGEAFHPFSLFPEHISFDISFWTASTYEEKEFHAVVREASHGTVERVKLIDRFSHPELSQTSYCYRLTYHSHTHALSHSQALQFHKQLESLLASRLQVTIR
ncbi:Ferredoxin-fold anticodon-binding domain-containing protein 1 [Takifugu flavidus]|uniref:phenylalanine--tRNA ligase n=1 Tax=Takifugu flavidus TaxID=433684 RepID=A0A5C6P949_9TELE|nr:Ferredoxin-fold anticodon-binding domain-containing protein 1 [Takifugu flavidus]